MRLHGAPGRDRRRQERRSGLPMFLAGSYLGRSLVAAGGAWLRRRDQTTIALLAIGAVFPLGYFFFWGTYDLVAHRQAQRADLLHPGCTRRSASSSPRRSSSCGAAAGRSASARRGGARRRHDAGRGESDRREPEAQQGPDPVEARRRSRSRARRWCSSPATGRYLMFLNPYSANDRRPPGPDRVRRRPGRRRPRSDRRAGRIARPYLQQASLTARRARARRPSRAHRRSRSPACMSCAARS